MNSILSNDSGHHPNVAKVEDAPDPRRTKGEAVVNSAEPLATKEMGYARLSRRVKNVAVSGIFCRHHQ
jgi:hypothetical protein